MIGKYGGLGKYWVMGKYGGGGMEVSSANIGVGDNGGNVDSGDNGGKYGRKFFLFIFEFLSDG